MLKRNLFYLILVILCQLGLAADNKYSFLDEIEMPAHRAVMERDTRWFPPAPPSLDVPLNGYYEEFEKAGTLSIYIGGGVQFYSSDWPRYLHEALQHANRKLGLNLSRIRRDGRHIAFEDSKGLNYQITIGHERNEFISALQDHQIAVYMGHSRYGRGPAFDEFSNYFRLGNIFSAIELDVRNHYFLQEPLVQTETYPPHAVKLDGKEYQFQYRGAKVESAHLDKDSYTKRIIGGPADFNKAAFRPGKKWILLNSCENVNYFRVPIRARFPDTQDVMVFGTLENSYVNPRTLLAFVVSIVERAPATRDVVEELNRIEDIFTAY